MKSLFAPSLITAFVLGLAATLLSQIFDKGFPLAWQHVLGETVITTDYVIFMWDVAIWTLIFFVVITSAFAYVLRRARLIDTLPG